jgi:tRNA(adenine34) deaminase
MDHPSVYTSGVTIAPQKAWPRTALSNLPVHSNGLEYGEMLRGLELHPPCFVSCPTVNAVRFLCTSHARRDFHHVWCRRHITPLDVLKARRQTNAVRRRCIATSGLEPGQSRGSDPAALPLRTVGTAADIDPMRIALQLAKDAYAAGEVPVGAVLIDENGLIVGRGRNRVEACGDATAHAEMEALRTTQCAGQRAQGWRRGDCTLYTTLEPCAMCCAAAGLARVRRIVYGAPDFRLGACGTWIDLPSIPHPFHNFKEVTSGVCADESAQLLKEFFRERRRLSKFG